MCGGICEAEIDVITWVGIPALGFGSVRQKYIFRSFYLILLR
jgi:hypothetical protein